MAGSEKPFITLIIPTRERAETLRFTLETALDQTKDNFEVIVSDNFSQDNTRRVVDSFRDPRLKYFNTGRRLSMCDNWDFAVAHAKGHYVIVIGDDDGILPGAIDRLQSFIRLNPSPIYYWQAHEYYWPIDDKPPAITHLAPTVPPRQMDLRKLVSFAVRWGTWRYGALPLLYHSAVRKDILEKIKSRTGRVFHSTNPDVFMAFALPVFADKAVNVGEGLTVSGRSAKSNGGSSVAKDGEVVFQKFVREYGDYRMHPTLYPGAPFAANMYADTALVAMELFPEYYTGMKFNYSAMWAHTQRILNFDGMMGILRNRKEINRYHPFSVPRFLLYWCIHKLMDLRVFLRKKLMTRKLMRLSEKCPENIREFVLFVERRVKCT